MPITPATSINLNTVARLLPIGGHLQQTQGLMGNGQPFQTGMVTMPTQLVPPNISQVGAVSGPQQFRNVIDNTIGGINATTQKPNELMQQAMAGGPVDIQDVMMANTKAELVISMTSQVMTKVIQAYEKLTQIQV